MPKEDEKEVITVDEKEYKIADLSDTAKSQIFNIQFVDSQIQQFNNELAVSDTARIAYTNALRNSLGKTK